MGDRAGGGGLVPDFTPITDHVAEALALLLEQYKEQPRLEALLTSYIAEAQYLEDTAVDVYLLRALAVATDAQLDTLGAIVGEMRNGRTDASFRRTIRVRILINNSDGRTEQLIVIADLFEAIGDGGGSVEVRDYPPASILVVLHDATLAEDPAETAIRLRLAKGGGIGLQLVHLPTGADASTFALGSTEAEALTDFGTDGTFTRASPATVWDGSALTRSASGELRRRLRSGIREYLLEPSRTNLIYNCHDLSTTYWGHDGSINLTTAIAGPTGFGDVATSVDWTLGGAIYNMYYKGSTYLDPLIIDNTTYVISLWARSVSGPPEMRVSTTRRDGTFGSFDLSLSSSWQRFTIQEDFLAGGTACTFGFKNYGASFSNAARVIEIAGVQVEQGAYATSLIETAGATATRATDSLTCLLSGAARNNGYTLYVEPIHILDERPSGAQTLLLRETSGASTTQIGFDSGASPVIARLYSTVATYPQISGFDYAAGDVLKMICNAPAGFFRIEGSSVVGSVEYSGSNVFAYDIGDETCTVLTTSGGNATAGWVSDLYKPEGYASLDPSRGLGSTTETTGGALAGVV